MRAIWLFASFWLIHSPFYKTHLLNIFSEIKNRINCCLCLKVSLKNGSISRYILEQWASESFQCLPFPYTRRICMNFTTIWCGSELTWQVCSMLFASLFQDAFFIIRSLSLRPCLLTKNRCYYVANDSLLLLSASFLKTGWMLRTLLTTVTNAGWRGDILKTRSSALPPRMSLSLLRHT